MRAKTFIYTAGCQLGEEYFADWNDLPQKLKDFWNENDDTPGCEGSGEMGLCCCDCPYKQFIEIEEE